MLRKSVLSLTCLLCLWHPARLWADQIPEYSTTPGIFDFLPQAFEDVPDFLQNADPRDHVSGYLQIGLWTTGLIAYDQDILIGSQELAKDWNLISDKDSGTRSRLVYRARVRDVDIDLRLPKGLNSYFYFIGDGLSTAAVIAGLCAYGASAQDNRAWNTASQITESTVLTGLFIITSKYTFGRQSPNQRTRDGGEWNPMPGPVRYLKNISSYDAFPSGHVATATSTLTVLAANYLEKSWIKPVGYGAIGLLMFSMLNNGVHWAADYPLGIAIGYTAAQTVLQNRMPTPKESLSQRSQLQWLPFAQGRHLGLMLDYKFSS